MCANFDNVSPLPLLQDLNRGLPLDTVGVLEIIAPSHLPMQAGISIDLTVAVFQTILCSHSNPRTLGMVPNMDWLCDPLPFEFSMFWLHPLLVLKPIVFITDDGQFDADISIFLLPIPSSVPVLGWC